jgi:hypothetical protein
MNDEIKEWKTRNVKHKVAFMLMSDGVSFHYNEEDGIVFSAPESYVKKMTYRLMICYGCIRRPVIEEY